MHFLMDHPEPILLHDEPIFRDGELVGMTTSGSFGYSLGRSVGMGYVNMPEGVDKAWFENAEYDIELSGELFAAKASIRSFFDPANERIKL